MRGHRWSWELKRNIIRLVINAIVERSTRGSPLGLPARCVEETDLSSDSSQAGRSADALRCDELDRALQQRKGLFLDQGNEFVFLDKQFDKQVANCVFLSERAATVVPLPAQGAKCHR